MDKIMRALSLWREKYSESSKEDQFKLYSLLFYNAPYVWGNENILETDCSGLICGPLILMGNEIRITADQIMTMLCSPHGSAEDVKLYFFTNSEGQAKHCGISVGYETIMHASGSRGVVIESIQSVENEYSDKGCQLHTAYLDFAKVEENEGLAYDIDSILH